MSRSKTHTSIVGLIRAAAMGVTLAVVAWTAVTPAAAAQGGPQKAKWKDARFIFEYNASAQDLGVQLFLDSEGWQSVKLMDPRGRVMLQATASGNLLAQGGGTELFLESVEPPLSEEPLDEILDRFPEGDYKLLGRMPDGTKIAGEVEISHDIPAGPHVVTPPQGSSCPHVSGPVVIDWDAVDETIDGEPVEIESYEVIVENAGNLDVILPASAGTKLTVPTEFLEPATDYIFEVLAIADNGNQTITEGCFSTN